MAPSEEPVPNQDVPKKDEKKKTEDEEELSEEDEKLKSELTMLVERLKVSTFARGQFAPMGSILLR